MLPVKWGEAVKDLDGLSKRQCDKCQFRLGLEYFRFIFQFFSWSTDRLINNEVDAQGDDDEDEF